MKAIRKTPVYWIVRIVLSLTIVFVFSACAAPAPLPAPTVPPSPSAAAPTSTSLPPTPLPSPTPVSVDEIFKNNLSFSVLLSGQDKQASKNFSVENGKTYLLVGGQKMEIDPASAGVNLDVNGKPLKVVDTGTPNPLTIRGVGESEGKVFSIAPETKIILEDDGKGNIKEKVFAAHWFEVIRTNHPVDQSATEKVKMEQRKEAINDPVKVTVEQVQSGEWAQSVLLSGAINPFPEKWKFTGNALYNNANDPGLGNVKLLYTSDKIPIDFFGVTTVGGKNIGLRPFQAWNPTDQKNPDRGEVLIANVGAGEERLTPDQNKAWLVYIYEIKFEPQLMVDSTDVLASSGDYALAGQPSILSLKKLPGNDPGLVFKFQIDDLNKRVGTELWQSGAFYIDPQYWNIQNLIWLTYFSADLSGNK